MITIVSWVIFACITNAFSVVILTKIAVEASLVLITNVKTLVRKILVARMPFALFQIKEPVVHVLWAWCQAQQPKSVASDRQLFHAQRTVIVPKAQHVSMIFVDQFVQMMRVA